MLLFSVWRSSEWEIPRHSLRSCSWPNGHLCSVHYTIISPVGLVFFSSSSSISLFPFVYSYSFFYIYWCVYWNITPHSSIVFFLLQTALSRSEWLSCPSPVVFPNNGQHFFRLENTIQVETCTAHMNILEEWWMARPGQDRLNRRKYSTDTGFKWRLEQNVGKQWNHLFSKQSRSKLSRSSKKLLHNTKALPLRQFFQEFHNNYLINFHIDSIRNWQKILGIHLKINKLHRYGIVALHEIKR